MSKGSPCSECGATIGRSGARGKCATCYQRERYLATRANGGRPCALEGCERRAYGGNRWCDTHRYRIRVYGDPGEVESRIKPRGTTHYHIAGIRKRMLADQDGKCGICGITESKRWVVDHDHRCCPAGDFCTECVRMVLCQACNVGLGMFQDDPEMLRRAADYIERHRN